MAERSGVQDYQLVACGEGAMTWILVIYLMVGWVMALLVMKMGEGEKLKWWEIAAIMVFWPLIVWFVVKKGE